MRLAIKLLGRAPAALLLSITPLVSHAGVSVVEVAEPDSLALLALGALGLALARKLRK